MKNVILCIHSRNADICIHTYSASSVVDAARADHMRTWKTMKIILKYLFKSTLLIRIIYLFYSFSILFYFIFRIRGVGVYANVTTMSYSYPHIPLHPTVLTAPVVIFFFFIAHTFFSRFRYLFANPIRIMVKTWNKVRKSRKKELFHILSHTIYGMGMMESQCRMLGLFIVTKLPNQRKYYLT